MLNSKFLLEELAAQFPVPTAFQQNFPDITLFSGNAAKSGTCDRVHEI